MKLGVYLLKPAVFTQKRRTTLVKHGSRLAVRTTGQLCKSVPLLFARSPFGAGAGGVEIYQYPVCCPLPSAALFTALPLGADTVDVASNIDNINRAALCEISAAGIVSACVVQAMPIHREHFVVVDGCYPCDMRCLIGRDLGVKTLHFFVFSPCNPAVAVIQYEQPPLWLVVIGSLLALIGV